MTPIQKELNNLRKKAEQEIRWSEAEIEEAERSIGINKRRIKYNEELLKELGESE